MSERWINQSRDLLKRMEAEATKNKDRLEVINSINLSIGAIERSIHGWVIWSENLHLMSRFSLEELEEMEEGLREQVRRFIEYDISITEKHQKKMPTQAPSPKRKPQTNSATQGLYV